MRCSYIAIGFGKFTKEDEIAEAEFRLVLSPEVGWECMFPWNSSILGRCSACFLLFVERIWLSGSLRVIGLRSDTLKGCERRLQDSSSFLATMKWSSATSTFLHPLRGGRLVNSSFVAEGRQCTAGCRVSTFWVRVLISLALPAGASLLTLRFLYESCSFSWTCILLRSHIALYCNSKEACMAA